VTRGQLPQRAGLAGLRRRWDWRRGTPRFATEPNVQLFAPVYVASCSTVGYHRQSVVHMSRGPTISDGTRKDHLHCQSLSFISIRP